LKYKIRKIGKDEMIESNFKDKGKKYIILIQ